MKREERQLFKMLCNVNTSYIDPQLMQHATPHVLGLLFMNRMQAVAYQILHKLGLLEKVNREFRSSLQSAWEQNIEKNKSMYLCIQYLNIILSDFAGKYAMLKGAILCGTYPVGCRTSNDIDLLVLPEHVTQIGEALHQAGFAQGYIKNGEFMPASRKEIIESKMLRGETVPYIKKVDIPGMRYLEVDINFSLDYKNGEINTLQELMSRVHSQQLLGQSIPTLDRWDFFLHLCAHLYKEAATFPWVKMKRDMTLYKYCDIYMLLREMKNAETAALFARAKSLGMEKVCAFAIIQTAALFDTNNDLAIALAQDTLQSDPAFLNRVFSPKDKKTLEYIETDICNRFYSDDRSALLKEVTM